MAQKRDYIAVLDSGIGGISVLRQLVKLLPEERFLYFGDSANAPYGDRPDSEILTLTLAAAEHILTRPVKALVVACNTATAVAVQTLRQRYPQLIVVGIEPAVKLAADRYPGGTVGMLSTSATLRSDRVTRLMEQHADRCRFIPLAAPELALLVEQGKANSEESLVLLNRLLLPYRKELDAVVLGCTHYPFAAETIRKCLGPEIPMLDGGPGTAARTRNLLAEADLLSDGPGELIIENSSEDPVMIARCRALLAEDPE